MYRPESSGEHSNPIPATRKLLARTGITIDDIDVVEMNEAFASQVLASMSELGIPQGRVNRTGGAIAIGHPLGASGARLVSRAVRELQRRESTYALVTMCVGVGQGLSALFEGIAARHHNSRCTPSIPPL